MGDSGPMRSFEQQPNNCRVHVEVVMAIHMVERKSRGAELFDLRFNLSAQLVSQTWEKEIAHSREHRAFSEFPVLIDQPGNPRLGQCGVPINQREMEPDSQSR